MTPVGLLLDNNYKSWSKSFCDVKIVEALVLTSGKFATGLSQLSAKTLVLFTSTLRLKSSFITYHFWILPSQSARPLPKQVVPFDDSTRTHSVGRWDVHWKFQEWLPNGIRFAFTFIPINRTSIPAPISHTLVSDMPNSTSLQLRWDSWCNDGMCYNNKTIRAKNLSMFLYPLFH